MLRTPGVLPRALYTRSPHAGSDKRRAHNAGLGLLRVASFLCACVVLLGALPRLSLAQNKTVDIPRGVGPLPDISGPTQSGAPVSRDQVRNYRVLLPEQLFDLVVAGEWAFEAVKAPPQPERFREPRPVLTSAHQVSGSGVLSPAPMRVEGALFPLDEESLGDGQLVAERGYKILWNVSSTLWRFPYLKADLSLMIFRESVSGGRRVRWSVERIHPGAFDKFPGTLTPLFRERISAEVPSVLRGLKWLTIRSLGAEPDFLWIASPITAHVRKVTGSNRGDEVFAGAFSPDDLFVWSGKVEQVKPTSVAHQTLLVPFALRSLASEVSDNACSTQRVTSTSVPVELNGTSHRFRGAAGWIPSNVVMAPRRVVRVSFASHDPFGLDTSTTLYIDEESHLPVYKVVWGRDGRLRSFTVGIVGSITQAGRHQPITLGQIITRATPGDRSVITIDALSTCKGFPDGLSFSHFDPATIGTQREGAGARTTTPAGKATASATDDGATQQFND